MHPNGLVHLLMQAFDGKACNPSISSEDRRAVILEFVRLYMETQAREREHRAQCQRDAVMHHIDQALSERFGYTIPTVDILPDPSYNIRARKSKIN